MTPTKRDLEEACTAVNGLSKQERKELVDGLKSICALDVQMNESVLEPFSKGYLIGLFARENRRHQG